MLNLRPREAAGGRAFESPDAGRFAQYGKRADLIVHERGSR
jgi:hypothetical protein